MKPFDKKLHFYIDDQLSEEEKADFEEQILQDADLRKAACELRKQKSDIQQHYQAIPLPNSPLAKAKKVHQQQQNIAVSWLKKPKTYGIAASLALFFTFTTFLFNTSNTKTHTLTASASTHKFLIHIDSNDPQKEKMAVIKAESLVRTAYEQGQPIQVEIVANYKGIELFNAENLDKLKILKTLSQYDNVKLLACKRAIERAKSEGHHIHLMAPVIQDKAAIDEIVSKMQQGWQYIKI